VRGRSDVRGSLGKEKRAWKGRKPGRKEDRPNTTPKTGRYLKKPSNSSPHGKEKGFPEGHEVEKIKNSRNSLLSPQLKNPRKPLLPRARRGAQGAPGRKILLEKGGNLKGSIEKNKGKSSFNPKRGS